MRTSTKSNTLSLLLSLISILLLINKDTSFIFEDKVNNIKIKSSKLEYIEYYVVLLEEYLNSIQLSENEIIDEFFNNKKEFDRFLSHKDDSFIIIFAAKLKQETDSLISTTKAENINDFIMNTLNTLKGEFTQNYIVIIEKLIKILGSQQNITKKIRKENRSLFDIVKKKYDETKQYLSDKIMINERLDEFYKIFGDLKMFLNLNPEAEEEKLNEFSEIEEQSVLVENPEVLNEINNPEQTNNTETVGVEEPNKEIITANPEIGKPSKETKKPSKSKGNKNKRKQKRRKNKHNKKNKYSTMKTIVAAVLIVLTVFVVVFCVGEIIGYFTKSSTKDLDN